MLFHSHIFLFIFLPLFLTGWYWLHSRKQKKLAQGYLIGMSLWFYAYLNPTYVWLLTGSCLAGYTICLLLKHTTSKKRRKILVTVGCLFHLGLLGYFKYAAFFVENINLLFRKDYVLTGVILPVGISFYTFQQLAFLVDCYREEQKLCSLLRYFTFMTYFPQLLQGPILLGEEFLTQLRKKELGIFDAALFLTGIRRFVLGFAKKVLLADTLAKTVNYGYENIVLLDSLSALLIAVGYLLELYFDFSGYCDMAVGLGKMIGLEVPENFDAPFRSVSVKEFWRRWHSTLGRFFTRYVYIPLGGSRKGKLRAFRNTLIVFTLSGLWHGAGWNFVLWGILHGIGVAFDNIKLFHFPFRKLRQAMTFLWVCFAFIFFRAATIGEGFLVLRTIFSLRWNGFLFSLAKALDLSETYIITKALAMKAPALLPWVELLLFCIVFGIAVIVIRGKKAADRVVDLPLTRRRSLGLSVLFVWSVLSLTGVGTYLYFSF